MVKYFLKTIKVSLLILVILSFNLINAKSSDIFNIDSLKTIYHTNKKDSVKIQIGLKLAYSYIFVEKNSDSADRYLKQTVAILKNINLPKKYLYYETISKYYRSSSQLDMWQEMLHLAVTDAETSGVEKKEIYRLKYWWSYSYSLTGYSHKALKLLLALIPDVEALKDKELLGETLMMTGFAYKMANDLKKAKTYFTKALEAFGNDLNIKHIDVVYSELGNIENTEKDYKKALEYLQKGLSIRKKTNSTAITYSYNDIACVFIKLKELDSAILYYKKAINTSQMYGSFYDRCMYFCNIATLYSKIKELDSAKVYFDFVDKRIKKVNSPVLYEKYYHALYVYYKNIPDFDQALEAYSMYVRFKDSIKGIDLEKQMNELSVKYETKEKEKENQLLTQKRKKDRIVIFSIAMGLVLVVFIALNINKHKKKLHITNSLLEEKNLQISQQKEELQIQTENLSEANNAITLQKEKIEDAHLQITQSIKYASRIQTAMLPANEILIKNFTDYFILYEPRDVVSGDFYWLKEIKNTVFIAVADCTGHGVPGAFVSMLGMAFLNEIATYENVLNAAQILESLRMHVKNALKQSGGFNETKDGMDIALCMIDKNTQQLNFAGAFNPLYIIRNNELTVLEATRNPIGIYLKETPFKYQNFELQTADKLYFFSDGFIDQIGGLNNGITNKMGKKFKKSRFKKLLLNIAHLPMNQQNTELKNTLKEWQGNFPQLDDITILGIEI